MNTLGNKIYNFNQIYDTLQTLTLEEYLSNKRNNVHSIIFEQALNSFIETVNSILDYMDFLGEEFSFTDEMFSWVPKSVQKTCNKIKQYIENNPEVIHFNKDNYDFIEYKNKNWLSPSNIYIVYSSGLVKIIQDETGDESYIRLGIGPISLEDFWDPSYMLNKYEQENLFNNDKENYVIEYIDYIKGICLMFNKMEMKYITVELSKIQDIKNFKYDGVLNDYNEMFHIKRNKSII